MSRLRASPQHFRPVSTSTTFLPPLALPGWAELNHDYRARASRKATARAPPRSDHYFAQNSTVKVQSSSRWVPPPTDALWATQEWVPPVKTPERRVTE